MPVTLSPSPRVNDPDMHQDLCVKHVRDACRDRWLPVSFEVGEENVPGIPGVWATRKFTYLERGPC